MPSYIGGRGRAERMLRYQFVANLGGGAPAESPTRFANGKLTH